MQNIDLKAIFVVTFCIAVNVTSVFLNKFVLTLVLRPFFVTFVQQVCGVIVLFIISRLARQVSFLSFFPQIQYNLASAIEVLPLSLAFVGILLFNNFCLRYVHVWFFLVARSLTSLFALIYGYFLNKTKPSVNAITACAVVSTGFIIGTVLSQDGGQDNLSNGRSPKSYGILFGVLSSLCNALYSMSVNRTLKYAKFREWTLLGYDTINSAIILFVLFIVSGDVVYVFYETNITIVFWLAITASGAFGILITFAVFFQMRYASSLINAISSTLKNIIQTIIAVIISYPVKGIDLLSIFCVIVGMFLFSYVRFHESQQENSNNESISLENTNIVIEDDKHSKD